MSDELIERLRGLSFALAAGGSEETNPNKLLDRIEWGIDHIQQVEAERSADLVESLSRNPRTTWGQVMQAIRNRGGPSERTADDGRVFTVPALTEDTHEQRGEG